MDNSPLRTALGGALVLYSQTWLWSDGQPAPNVRPMRLNHLAPNFRVVSGIVEVPADWQDKRHWPDRRIDQDAFREIAILTANERGKQMIYAEGAAEAMDDHRLQRPGYRVPVADWDAVMRQVVGAWWDEADEAAILARAKELAPS